jgi:hypothetical protein
VGGPSAQQDGRLSSQPSHGYPHQLAGAPSYGTLWACGTHGPFEQRPQPMAGRHCRPAGWPICSVLVLFLKLLGTFIARNRLQLHHHHLLWEINLGHARARNMLPQQNPPRSSWSARLSSLDAESVSRQHRPLASFMTLPGFPPVGFPVRRRTRRR